MRTINLGDQVKCKITNLEGVVTAYSENLTGCDRVFVQPTADKEGKYREGYWIDVGVAKIIKAGKVKPNEVSSGRPGGPMSKEK